jgi:membrane protein YdbS with pleckstrin-like domain
MTLNQLAMWNTAKKFALVILGSVIVNVAVYFWGWPAVGTIIAAAVMIYAVNMLYQMEKDRLERENTLKKIKETN